MKFYTYDDGEDIRVPRSYRSSISTRPVTGGRCRARRVAVRAGRQQCQRSDVPHRHRVAAARRVHAAAGGSTSASPSSSPGGRRTPAYGSSTEQRARAGRGRGRHRVRQRRHPAGGRRQPQSPWKIVPAENGYYKIINTNSGLVLGISGASKTAGGDRTAVGRQPHRRPPVVVRRRRRRLVQDRQPNSGLLLGIQDASTASGAVALQWTDNGTPDHLWRLGADTSAPGGVGGTVPATLSLTLGAPASSARSRRASTRSTRPRRRRT